MQVSTPSSRLDSLPGVSARHAEEGQGRNPEVPEGSGVGEEELGLEHSTSEVRRIRGKGRRA